MAQFEPYLSFDGNCAEAMRFYEKTLGARTEMSMTYGEAPPMPGQPAASGDAARRIMHVSMTLEGHRLMASDTPPGMPFEGMKGMTVSLAYPEAAKGRRFRLVMTASIFADGRIEKIEIDRPSGNPEVDAAAVRIVKLAGPYGRFSDAMHAKYGVLDLTMTWTFAREDALSVEGSN